MGLDDPTPAAYLTDPDENPIGVLVRDGTRRLAVDANPRAIPSNPEDLIRGFVTNGGSADLLVDGSTTPVVFTFEAESGPGAEDVTLDELRIVLTCDKLKFEPAGNFGGESALTNGLKVEITKGGTTTEIANLKQNEEIFLFATKVYPFSAKTNDVAIAGLELGGAWVLSAGTTDKISVTVRDNLDPPGSGLYFLRAAIFGCRCGA